MKKKIFIIWLAFLFLSSCLSAQLQAEDEKEFEPEERTALDDNRTKITIKTNIPKSSVFINEIFQGVTNLTVSDLQEGTYAIRVEKAGFKTERKVILVEKGESRTFFVELEKD